MTYRHDMTVALDDGREIEVAVTLARGPRAWILSMFGLEAIALPWDSVWMDEDCFASHETRHHESVHIRQMHRDGRVIFCWRYLWQAMTVGYWRIDYEIEAYEDTEAWMSRRRRHAPVVCLEHHDAGRSE